MISEAHDCRTQQNLLSAYIPTYDCEILKWHFV